MDTILQLHEFFVEGKNHQKSHVLLNITEPTTDKEKEKGYFFAICEISNGDNKYILKLQNIIDEIENSYYEVSDDEDKTSLELILDKINQQSFTLLKSDIELNCTVGAIRQTDVIFSFHGQPQILLFYKQKQGDYKKIDLVSQNSDDPEKKEKYLFSQMIQGKIGYNDYFFAGTNKIVNYFSHDRLQKIISTRPPRQSAEHLQKVLNELKSKLSFGGIIIHLQKQDSDQQSKKRMVKKGTSAKSLIGLFNTEKNTANILSPSLIPRLGARLTSAFKKTSGQQVGTKNIEEEEMNGYAPAEISSAHLRPRRTQSLDVQKINSINLQKILLFAGQKIWQTLKYLTKVIIWLALFIAAILTGLVKNAALLFLVATNYHDRRQNILNDWNRVWKSHKENIKQLPISIKIMVALSMVLLIILVSSVLYIKNKQQKEKSAQFFANNIQIIKNKKDSAESSLIYNDLTSAFNELQTAKKTLENLDCKENRQEICKKLNNELETLLKKIRKIYTISPELLADWDKLSTQNQTQAQKIFLIDKKIIGFNTDNSNISAYNLLSKSSEPVSLDISLNNINTAAVPKENDYAILIYDKNKLAKFETKNNSWKKVDISYSNENAEIDSASVYSRRLYTLDSANNQIYRHDPINSGFGSGREWIKDNSTINLQKGASLAIDGDVFALNNNGELYKFSSGEKQEFNIQGLDPALVSADALWTYYELNYLYILDSNNKRLIILNKEDGSLKKQITAEKFVKPTDMVIDEKNDVGYILDSNKLYKIELGL